jgi:hypothetical protein
MDYALLFPGRFLKSVEFKGRDVTLKIAKVYTEEMEDKKGLKVKGIVKFEGTKKELVLNRTNAECIKAMFGRETDGWVGKRVTFWPAPYHDNTTGEDTTAIRVRGSPDIAADMVTVIALPQKKPVEMRLKKTGQKNTAKPTAKQAAPTPPPPSSEPQAEDSAMPPDFEEPPPFDPVTGGVLA